MDRQMRQVAICAMCMQIVAGQGLLTPLDAFMPEQSEGKSSTSLIMVILVAMVITAELMYNIYLWCKRKFGARASEEQKTPMYPM